MDQCNCLTTKGRQCTRYSLPGSQFCRIHQKCQQQVTRMSSISKETVDEIVRRKDNYGNLLKIITLSNEGKGIETGLELVDVDLTYDFIKFLAGLGFSAQNTLSKDSNITTEQIKPYVSFYEAEGRPRGHDAFFSGIKYSESGLSAEEIKEIVTRYQSAKNFKQLYQPIRSAIKYDDEQIEDFYIFVAGTGFNPQKYSPRVIEKMLGPIIELYELLDRPAEELAFIGGLSYDFI